MRAQEIFDTVVEHLFTQGKPAVGNEPTSACLYRGPGGTSCAVGCLITDEEYDPDMEGNDVWMYRDGFKDKFPSRLKRHMVMLAELQDVHDGSDVRSFDANSNAIFDKEALYRELRQIALNHKYKQDTLNKYRPVA